MRAVAKGPLRIAFLVLVMSLVGWLGPGLTGVRAVDDMENLCAEDMQWMIGWCIDTVATGDDQGTGDVAALAGPGASAVSGEFTSIDVPFPDVSATPVLGTRAFGINPQGDIVGSYTNATGTHGYLLRNGVFTTLDYPGAATTEAWGINSRGDIIGRYTSSGVAGVRGFLLSHGSYTDISVGNHLVTLPTKIGESELIVGCIHDASPLFDMFGYVQRGSDVTLFALPSQTFPAGSSAMHNGITPGGRTVVGLTFDGALNRAHGYVIRGDDEPTLLDFPGSSFTQAWDVNPRGTIVGQYAAGGRQHGFYLDETGYVTIDVPGSVLTVARGINPEGDIVGVHNDAAGGTHGFLLRR